MTLSPDVRMRLSHRHLRYNCPLGDEEAHALCAALAGEGLRLLDLGCGTGRLVTTLLRRCDARSTARGVDIEPSFIAAALGARRADETERLVFEVGDAAAVTETADRVLCVGAHHAWPSPAACLSALAARLRPGGRLLFGAAFWQSPPSAEALALLGPQRDRDGWARDLADAGLAPLRVSHASEETFDDFEARWCRGFAESDDAAHRAFGASREETYRRVYRGQLGFLWVIAKRA